MANKTLKEFQSSSTYSTLDVGDSQIDDPAGFSRFGYFWGHVPVPLQSTLTPRRGNDVGCIYECTCSLRILPSYGLGQVSSSIYVSRLDDAILRRRVLSEVLTLIVSLGVYG